MGGAGDRMGATRASETLPGRRSDGDGDLAGAGDQPSDDLSLDQRGGTGPEPRGGPLRSAASGAHQAGPVQGDRAGTAGGVSGVDGRAAARGDPRGGVSRRLHAAQGVRWKVRPRPPADPLVRFDTDPGVQGQVDFAHFRFPWGRRYALLVVLGYSQQTGRRSRPWPRAPWRARSTTCSSWARPASARATSPWRSA